MDGIQQDLEFVQQKLKRIHSTFENFLAMTKTFSKEEFSSIYCEREWRSTEPFDFEFEHVAMIVLPREVSGRAYYRPFVESSDDLKVPRTIPIVPWDDLVEH